VKAGAPDEVLAGSCSWACTVSSWLGGTLLSSTVPVMSGRVTASVTQPLLERVTLTVPRFASGVDWAPGQDPRHPLARYGQELQVSVTVGSSVSSDTWDTRVGRFVVADWDDDDRGTVQVTGDGLLRNVQTDLLTAPVQPYLDGTLTSEARRLLPLGMAAAFDPALVDRPCPPSMSWSEDRLSALQEIADAWPALLHTDEWGQVVFSAPLPDVPTPVLTFQDGPRGTVRAVPRSDTRADAVNRVIARSSMTADVDIQAVVDVQDGPMSTGGDYKVVAKKFSSPLLTSEQECQVAGATMLANSVRPTNVVSVTCAPDPRVSLHDPVEVLRDGERIWGWVVGYDLPLTWRDGPMRVDVGVSA
jgi:hypothetical protein